MFTQKTKLNLTNYEQLERSNQNKLVLEHIVGYIQKLSDESRSGLSYSAKEVETIVQGLPKGSAQRESLEYVHKFLLHLSDRMEYIDAHKSQPWDEMKYRKFITQYCPTKPGEDE